MVLSDLHCPLLSGLSGFLSPRDPHLPGLWFFLAHPTASVLKHLLEAVAGLEGPWLCGRVLSTPWRWAPLLSGLCPWAWGWLLGAGFSLAVAQSSFARRAHSLVLSFSPHCQRAGGSGPSWHSSPRRQWAGHTPGAPIPFSVLSGHCLLSGVAFVVPSISLQKDEAPR